MTRFWYTVLIVAATLFAVWFLWPKDDEPAKPPDKGSVEIPKGDDITIGDEEETPALPEGFQPEPGDKVITVKAKEDIPKGTEFKILVPKEKPAVALSDSGRQVIEATDSKVELTQQEFTEPWFHIKPEIVAGFALNRYLEPTPIVMASGLCLWSRIRLGGAVDRFGLGPSVAVEFMENLAAVAKWNLIDYHSRPVQVSIGVGYCF